jgi:hypothetical protein
LHFSFFDLTDLSSSNSPADPAKTIRRSDGLKATNLESQRSVAAEAEGAKENPQWQEKQYFTGGKLKLRRQSPKFTSFG